LDAGGPFAVPKARILTHPMKKPIIEFRLDEVTDKVHQAFTELCHPEEFQPVDSFRRQVFLAVEYMRSEELMVPFREIGTIFRVLKATIVKHFQRAQTERQNVGRPLCIDKAAWPHLRQFFFKRFQKQSPVTTKDALAFLAGHCDVHLLANTMRIKTRNAPELRMVRNVPMEKRRLDCDITEIELYFQMLTENVSAVPAAFVFNPDESGF
jgi:hypothetical protein